MVASRAGAIRRQLALGTPLHHTCHQIFGAAHPGSFAAVYVIGIPTDGLFDCRVPSGSARAGMGHPSIISPRLLLMRVSVMGNRGVGDGWKIFRGVVGKNRRAEAGSARAGS